MAATVKKVMFRPPQSRTGGYDWCKAKGVVGGEAIVIGARLDLMSTGGGEANQRQWWCQCESSGGKWLNLLVVILDF